MNLIPMKSVLLVGACFLFLSCSKDKKETSKSVISNSNVVRFLWTAQSQETPQINVINQFGEPVVAAQILIGSEADVPFSGNLIQTDQSGIAAIPAEWTAPDHVTVDATGYVRITLLNQQPGDLIIRLSPKHLATKPEIRGEVTQLPVVNSDKLIDFGLVMPALNRSDLLNFDINQVLSPYSDVLTVAGQESRVPTNISLPTQKESYIFSVTISKPVYSMQVATFGPKRFFAARGQFVFKDVIGEIRAGKPFYELINYFSILGGSIRDTTIVNPVTNLNIPANELDFKNSFTVTTPNIQSDELLLVLAASQVAGSLIPTDIKKTTGGQTLVLSSLGGKPAFILNVVKRESEFMATSSGADRMSVSILPYTVGIKQEMLPLVKNPSISTSGGYRITLPSPPTTAGIFPIATSISISDLTEATSGASKFFVARPRWEVLGLGWNSQVQLPKWPLRGTASKMRVGINFIGSNKNSNPSLDDSLIEAATHVSHASTDF
ncbi:MAG: hypothetical protein H7328_04920 [Bdellovibrio sp.]|nr:hypothetical protein [Bdellovibrio sp.]